jgi:tetratricopeptide (TPR) repeat protein
MLLVTGLGDIARLMGEHRQAEQLHQEALAIGREIGERRGVAMCLENLGRLAFDKEEYRQAEAQFLESLKLYEKMGHRHGQATALCQSGMAALSLGKERYGEAEQRLYRALCISTEIGATPLILDVLRGYAKLWTIRATSHDVQAKALELLSLILSHKASGRETKDHATRLWGELSSELPPGFIIQAMNRAQTMDVQSIAKEILSLKAE